MGRIISAQGQIITARSLDTANHRIPFPWIAVGEDGRIVSIEPGEAADRKTAALETGDETTTLTSTFLDVHIHGAMGHDVMQESAEGFAAMERFLASRGVGHYLPTTVTAPVDATLRALERLANHIEQAAARECGGGATPIGIHLEGPFLSHVKRGVHDAALLQRPEIGLFERFYEAARGHIRLMTIAPETPGALDLIRHATGRGVKMSIGHTNATAAESYAAIAAGATSATHTFNAMRSMEHRDPGVAGVVLTSRATFAELICDGIHVAPEMVEVFLRCKGMERAILVTDGISATGMPEGRYLLGDFEVEVANGRAMARGVLAGSVLTMDRAVANLAQFTGTPVVQAVHAASHSPARMLGVEKELQIAVGQPANFNRYAADGTLVETMLAGRVVA